MFHAAIKYAVFQDFQRGRQRYQLAADAASLATVQMDDAAESGIYTGPNLDSLLTPPNSVNRGLPHILLALEVPGLPEVPLVSSPFYSFLPPSPSLILQCACLMSFL